MLCRVLSVNSSYMSGDMLCILNLGLPRIIFICKMTAGKLISHSLLEVTLLPITVNRIHLFIFPSQSGLFISCKHCQYYLLVIVFLQVTCVVHNIRRCIKDLSTAILSFTNDMYLPPVMGQQKDPTIGRKFHTWSPTLSTSEQLSQHL